MFDNDNEDEPIVRLLSFEEKVIEDFRSGKIEHVRTAGYMVRDAELYDNFGDKVDVDDHSDD